MTCAKNCNTSDVQVILDVAAGVFVISVFDDQEAFIEFDDDEAKINIKRDSLGNVYAAGSDYVIRPFTLLVPCSDEATALDRAWITSPMSMCGSLEMITACCQDYSFESLRLTGVNAPAVGTEIGIYSFSFEGVVK